VGDAIALIRNDEHVLALARLSSLKQANPQNSSLRILASYALLQVGNLVGAFEEAEKAHTAPNGNSYRCWFLAKVALLNGKKSRCERELEHLKRIGDMAAEAAELEKELARK
jgi:Flp pilus assembly protein TadD